MRKLLVHQAWGNRTERLCYVDKKGGRVKVRGIVEDLERKNEHGE